MNYKQHNKLTMYLAVRQICRSNAAIWNTIPAAVRAITDLDTCIQTIQESLRNQDRRLTGVSLDKAGIRRSMINQAYQIAQATVTYAQDLKNFELAHSLDHTMASWKLHRGNTVKEMAEQVLQAARSLTPALADYGITPDDVTVLESLVLGYGEKLGAPRMAINSRRAATQTLEECFRTSDELLQSLDRLLIQRKDSPFYKMYKSARKVVHYRGRGEKVTVPEPMPVEQN